MIYKGHDLDLRTLQGEGQTLPPSVSDPKPGVYKHTFESSRKIDKTIWVDETAMRLCNQAHDLAAALGANEVELSHLICAATQLRATVPILNELNMNVSKLRRDVASHLLDEKPKISWDGKSSPRKSGEFEDVLRASAKRAYKRRSPVSTADIIDALFAMSRDNPTRDLLTRFNGDFELRSDAGVESEEIQSRNGRRRMRVSAKSNNIGDADRLLNGVPTVTDTHDKMRMDALERAIRALTESMGQPAQSPAPSHHGVDLHNGSNGGWSNGSYNGDQSDIHYLVSRVERNVNDKFSELSRTWSVLGERLDALENTLREFDTDSGGGGVTPELEARLKTLTFAHERLDTLHELVTSVSERLSDLDTGEGGIELAPVMSGINDVEAGLRGIGGQLREVDSRTGDVSLTVEEINSRNKHLETMLEEQQEQINGLKSFIREEVGQISISGGEVDGGLITRAIENSLQDMTASFDRQREATAGLVNRAVAERFAAIQLPGRMARIEEHMKDAAERPIAVSENGDIDVSVVNDTVSKILTNQDRMAGVIEDMNQASKTELSALRARLDTFDYQPASPQVPVGYFDEINAQLKDLKDRMDQPQQVPQQIQPTDSWTRLKLWLFGTSDWYAASWNSREDAGLWRPPGRDNVDSTARANEQDYEHRRV